MIILLIFYVTVWLTTDSIEIREKDMVELVRIWAVKGSHWLTSHFS